MKCWITDSLAFGARSFTFGFAGWRQLKIFCSSATSPVALTFIIKHDIDKESQVCVNEVQWDVHDAYTGTLGSCL